MNLEFFPNRIKRFSGTVKDTKKSWLLNACFCRDDSFFIQGSDIYIHQEPTLMVLICYYFIF
jgi:hypothetical protein